MTIQLVYLFLIHFGNEVALALLSSFIFYIIIIYYPTKRSIKNSSNFLIKKYKKVKIKIIEQILMTLRRSLGSQNLLNEKYADYNYLRKLISDEDIIAIRSLDEQEMKELSYEINYYLSDLRTFLSIEISKQYIQVNEDAYNRISNLISWIDQFHHHHKTISLEHEYDKYLRNYIQDFILGLTTANSSQETPFDLFPKIIKSAYKNSLLSEKINRPCRSLLNI